MSSVVQYSSVILNVIKTNHYRRTLVKSGTDRVAIEHELSVRATFNPSTQQDVLAGDVVPAFPGVAALPVIAVGGVVGPHAGRLLQGPIPPDLTRPAALTAEAVKHVLLQPRLQLTWQMQGVRILTSPLAGFTVDSTNGPWPVSCDVVEIDSGKTFLVDFVIKTTTSDCPRFGPNASPILSHLWTAEDELDDSFYTVRRTKGRVVFDAAIITRAGFAAIPDNYRSQFLHPVPSNMKRERVSVRVNEEGTVGEYEIIDRELSLNINSSVVTKVEASHTVSQTVPDLSLGPIFGKRAADISVITLGARIRSIIGSLSPIPFSSKASERWFDRIWGGLLGGGFLATSHHIIHVKAWGTRNSSRNQIESFIRTLLTTRIAPLRVGLGFATDYKVRHDIAGTNVEVVSEWIGGPLTPVGVIPTTMLGTAVFLPTNDSPGSLVADFGVVTLRPPADNVGRGTFLYNILTAALSTPCAGSTNIPPPSPTVILASPPLAGTPPTWPKPAPYVPR